MREQQIASTILQQLGGNRFLAMTGAHSASIAVRGLSLKLPRNKSKAQYLHIMLDDDDTYTMKFMRMRNFHLENVKEINGVYCDKMRSIFTETTGLETSL